HRAVPTNSIRARNGGTRSLSSGAHSREPVALPTLRAALQTIRIGFAETAPHPTLSPQAGRGSAPSCARHEDGVSFSLSPFLRRGVRGILGITELHLVRGCSATARIDRWRLIDGGKGSTGKQELADEFAEPKVWHFGAVYPRGEAQQQIGD